MENAFSVRNQPSFLHSFLPCLHLSILTLCGASSLPLRPVSLSGVKLHICTTQEKGPKFPKELSEFNQGEENTDFSHYTKWDGVTKPNSLET